MFYVAYLHPNSQKILVINPKRQLRSYEIKSGLGMDHNASIPIFIIEIVLKEFVGVNSQPQNKVSYYEWKGVYQ